MGVNYKTIFNKLNNNNKKRKENADTIFQQVSFKSPKHRRWFELDFWSLFICTNVGHT